MESVEGIPTTSLEKRRGIEFRAAFILQAGRFVGKHEDRQFAMLEHRLSALMLSNRA